MQSTRTKRILGLLCLIFMTLITSCERGDVVIQEDNNQKPSFNNLLKSNVTSSSITVDVTATTPDGFTFDESGWVIGTSSDINLTQNEGVSKNIEKNMFKVSFNNLKPQTNYYLKAYIKKGSEEFYSLAFTVTTEILVEWKAPESTTATPSSISLDLAIKNSASVVQSISKMGINFRKGSQLGSNPDKVEITPIDLPTTYILENLESDTEYAVQYFLENYDGLITSEIAVFKTLKAEEDPKEEDPKDPDPTEEEEEIVLANVKTNAPAQVSGKTYSLSGTLENTGNDPETKVGIEISRSSDFGTLVDNLVIVLGSSNTFSKEYTFSDFSTTYYVRAYAQNKAGRSEGITQAVTTPDESSDFASVNAKAKTGRVYELTATLAKDITLTKTGFYISKNANPKTGGVFIAGAKTKTFTGTTAALEAGTKYYYQAVAENASGEILSQVNTIDVPAAATLGEPTLGYSNGSFKMTGKINNSKTATIDEYGFLLSLNGEAEFKLKIGNINSEGVFTNSILIPYGEVKAKSYMVVDGKQTTSSQKIFTEKPTLLVWESALAILENNKILMEATFNHVRKRQVQETGFYMSTDINKVGTANNSNGKGGFTGQKFKGTGTVEVVKNGVPTQFFDFNGASFEEGKTYYIRPYAKVFDVEYSTKGAPVTLSIPQTVKASPNKPEVKYTSGQFLWTTEVANATAGNVTERGVLVSLNGQAEQKIVSGDYNASTRKYTNVLTVPYGQVKARAYIIVDGNQVTSSFVEFTRKPIKMDWKNFTAELKNDKIEMAATARYMRKAQVQEVGFYISTDINAVGGSNNSTGKGGFGNATKVPGGSTIELETDGVPRQFFDASTSRIDKGKTYYVRPFIKLFGDEYSTEGAPIEVEVKNDETASKPSNPIISHDKVGKFTISGKVNVSSVNQIVEYGFIINQDQAAEKIVRASNMNSSGEFSIDINERYGIMRAKSYAKIGNTTETSDESKLIERPGEPVGNINANLFPIDLFNQFFEKVNISSSGSNLVLEATLQNLRKDQIQEIGFFFESNGDGGVGNVDLDIVGSTGVDFLAGKLLGDTKKIKLETNELVELNRGNGKVALFFDKTQFNISKGTRYYVRPYVKAFDRIYSKLMEYDYISGRFNAYTDRDIKIGTLLVLTNDGKYVAKNRKDLDTEIDQTFAASGLNCQNFNSKIIDLNFIDTRLVTDMSDLFSKRDLDRPISFCIEDRSSFNRLVRYDISKWDVSNVTNMNVMFRETFVNMKNISNWDVGNVEYMFEMFTGATFVNESATLNIKNWDVRNVKNMSYMFLGSDFNQDISGWRPEKIERMEYMFNDATNFNQNLENWNIKPDVNTEKMFDGSGMTTLPSWYKP